MKSEIQSEIEKKKRVNGVEKGIIEKKMKREIIKKRMDEKMKKKKMKRIGKK